MNREEVIRMAREAGVYSGANEMVFSASLERFAALVAAAEREACAKVCDEVIRDRDLYLVDGDGSEEVLRCAKTIRSRGEERGEAVTDLNLEGLTDAQLRLFAVRCARRGQHLMTDPRSLAALDVAERHARGEATDEELLAAWAAAWDAAWDAAWAAELAAARAAALAAADAARAAAEAASADAARAAAEAARAVERAEHRKILDSIKEVKP